MTRKPITLKLHNRKEKSNYATEVFSCAIGADRNKPVDVGAGNTTIILDFYGLLSECEYTLKVLFKMCVPFRYVYYGHHYLEIELKHVDILIDSDGITLSR